MAANGTHSYNEIAAPAGGRIKAWTSGVAFEEECREQVARVADLPFIYKWVAVMPDVHLGKGAAVGMVIPTRGAVIPAAVGVDIGCGMVAQRTSLRAQDLPEQLGKLRAAIEKAVPHGQKGKQAGWREIPNAARQAWRPLAADFARLVEKHPVLAEANHLNHLGSLGGGNHFIEICLDEGQQVWVMLHSGSRGVGNRIGTYFIEMARQDMRVHVRNLPDADLAYLQEGTVGFSDYVEAVGWAQRFAAQNRAVMMDLVLAALRASGLPEFVLLDQAINCHHNYVAVEEHFGESVLVTRKGAVRARRGDLGIIPGSMGAASFIVRGLGNADSFHSCSHGAGRLMSRGEAKRRFSLADHAVATAGVECRRDVSVLDETPAAYKSIKQVMTAQQDLVETVHALKQVICVKG